MEPQEGIIEGCLRKDRKSQYVLYQQFSPMLYGLCLRYLRDEETAADMLQECFIKIFDKINDYRGEGSFEGWMRKLAVNTLLNEIKRQQHTQIFDTLSEDLDTITSVSHQPDRLTQEELIAVIHKLPSGYRTVFNLYEIEGYSHQEIAEILGISESTSKTQLRNAKIRLQQVLYQMYGMTSFE